MAKLSSLLTDEAWEVRAAAAGALMAVTTTDPGKKAIVPANGVEPLINLLQDEQRLVKLNVLKTMANVAVNPDVREQLKVSPTTNLSAALQSKTATNKSRYLPRIFFAADPASTQPSPPPPPLLPPPRRCRRAFCRLFPL